MINTNKFNSIDNSIDISKYSSENISHLLGCAEIFGHGKEKAIQDDNQWNENNDRDTNAKKLAASPTNFVTTIITNIRDQSKWAPTNSLDNASLYLRNYLDYLYQIRTCNYISNFNSRSSSFKTNNPDQLAEHIIATHKFIDNDERASLTKELAANLADFVKFNEEDHNFIQFIEPVIKADKQAKLFYYSLYSNPASGYDFNYIAQEFIFDPNKLTIENANIELNKNYEGLKRWLDKNRAKKTPQN
ncbi:hypothetical protein QE197_10005 [Arsenophonus nasoniae]|uniref:Uncharacterized protein n=1 Tax=Arsenophonus nasoniae TaxID=638 RepID=D2U215_9GAMM|nr:hypothetical protein [Arsenophonus nasoniae]QBY43785.1 hypothetical protein ArsFIN_23540 [Arsenophonus nasoniae]WGM00149.1 hypothetical protein QE210_09585 [Arsenophonus nasoniae]WGM04138.1 hypothetical protein QE258_10725 [Arsenophonus nasoniae]WGM09243.1 hypothetical protein QE197_10005 [Arsenophonus nasoniae]WGM13965.1 hypothetical protein QE193_09890 [Arsenophonus nasoniae]